MVLTYRLLKVNGIKVKSIHDSMENKADKQIKNTVHAVKSVGYDLKVGSF